MASHWNYRWPHQALWGDVERWACATHTTAERNSTVYLYRLIFASKSSFCLEVLGVCSLSWAVAYLFFLVLKWLFTIRLSSHSSADHHDSWRVQGFYGLALCRLSSHPPRRAAPKRLRVRLRAMYAAASSQHLALHTGYHFLVIAWKRRCARVALSLA